MSTQAVTATIGNGRMSKVFSGTITDGVWTNIQDSLSQTNLGILIPRAVITNVQAEYSAGLAAWRIQNAQTLKVSRRGWAAVVNNSCYKSTVIPAHSVNPDEMIQIYPQVEAGAAQTNALAWVTTTKGTELYEATDINDDTATEMKTALQQQSFGDAAFNSTLTGLSICLQDGRRLEKIEFIDSAGGVVLTLQGNFRIPNKGKGGGVSAYYNFEAMGMSLPVTKGYTMKITTKDAQN